MSRACGTFPREVYAGTGIIDLPAQSDPGGTASGVARLYFDGTALKVHFGTGAALSISTGAVTLQQAYTGGATITVAATSPVTIQNAAGVASNLLALNELNTATNADVGLTWTRSATPAFGAAFTGGAIAILNAPSIANGVTHESGTLLSITHAPTNGGGFGGEQDNTTGASITMTPVVLGAGTGTTTGLTVAVNAAYSQARGATITMGAGLPGGSSALIVDWRAASGTVGSGPQGIVVVNVGAATTLANNIIGCTIDLSTNVTPGSNPVNGLTIKTPATTAATLTSANSCLALVSSATAATVLNCSVANTSGTIWAVQYPSSTTASNLTGFLIDLASNVTGQGGGSIGLSVKMSGTFTSALAAQFTGAPISCPGNGSSSERFGAGAFANGSSAVAFGNGASASVASAIAIGQGVVVSGLSGIGIGSGTTSQEGIVIGGASSVSTHGVAIGTFVTASQDGSVAIGNQATATQPGTTAVGTTSGASGTNSAAFGYGAGASSTGTAAFGAVATATALTATALGAGASATASGALALGNGALANVANSLVVGPSISDVYLGNGITSASPQSVTIHATGKTGGTGQGATLTLAAGLGGSTGGGINFALANPSAPTSGVVNFAQISYQGSMSLTALTSDVAPLIVQNSASVTSNNAIVNIRDLTTGTSANAGLYYSRVVTPDAGSTFSGTAITIFDEPAAGANACTEAGTLISVLHAPTGSALVDTTTGLALTMTPPANVSNGVVGISVTMGANCGNTSALIVDYRSTAGSTQGIVDIRVGAATTFTGAVVGLNLNLSANVTAGSQNVTGLQITTPATTGMTSVVASVGANAQSGTYGMFAELVTLSTGGTTTPTTNTIPANSFILGVVAYVQTTITTATSWQVGDEATASRFISTQSGVAAGSSAVGLNHLQGAVSTNATGPVVTSPTNLQITTNIAPGAGKIRLCVWYFTFGAPTS